MKGFTLLEVMVALAIMAGVVVTCITTFNRHLSLVIEDGEETRQVLLARAKLEELEAGGNLPEKKDGKFLEWPGLEWRMTKEPWMLKGIAKISVTVGPKDGKGVTLAHYVAQ